MNSERYASLISNFDLVKEFIGFALKEYGEIKLKDIYRKVNSSDKIKNFIIESRRIGLQLGSDDFISTIHSSIHFAFSKPETIAIASIILLRKWENEVGTSLNIVDNIYLNKRLFLILEKCNRFKTHIKNGSNFFEKFYESITIKYDGLMKLTRSHKIPDFDLISFNVKDLMIRAIYDGIKTEYRVTTNLEVINIAPSIWHFEEIDPAKGAVFFSSELNQTTIIPFPNRSERKSIWMYDNQDSVIVNINSYGIQRFRDVAPPDAINEGFGIYTDEIAEILNDDYAADAELCLFEKHWMETYGKECLQKNIYVWVLGIELGMA